MRSAGALAILALCAQLVAAVTCGWGDAFAAEDVGAQLTVFCPCHVGDDAAPAPNAASVPALLPERDALPTPSVLAFDLAPATPRAPWRSLPVPERVPRA